MQCLRLYVEDLRPKLTLVVWILCGGGSDPDYQAELLYHCDELIIVYCIALDRVQRQRLLVSGPNVWPTRLNGCNVMYLYVH